MPDAAAIAWESEEVMLAKVTTFQQLTEISVPRQRLIQLLAEHSGCVVTVFDKKP